MNLAQHFTPNPHASLLVQKMHPFASSNKGMNGVDLGAGRGALLYSATKRWKDASFWGVDVSPSLLKTIKRHFPLVQFRCLDLLSATSLKSKILKDLAESRDVAVCNPPFLNYRNDAFFRDLCRMVNLKECGKISVVTSDVIFLLHNLRLLKKGGTLGIILPDGLITGKKFQILRQSLLSNHRIEAVIQLPDNSFPGIEVRTHILILRKDMTPAVSVKVMQAGADSINGELEVEASALELRMDYSYWHWKLIEKNVNALTLAEIGADIHRGTRSQLFFENLGIDYFHTTELPRGAKRIKLRRSKSLGFRMAESQDILTARVGKRCIGRVTLVGKGTLPITDCIYRIRVPKCWVNRVWQSLISDKARDWFSAHSHGVCAQIISKSDILNFPVGY